jgi:hypothetical protein
MSRPPGSRSSSRAQCGQLSGGSSSELPARSGTPAPSSSSSATGSGELAGPHGWLSGGNAAGSGAGELRPSTRSGRRSPLMSAPAPARRRPGPPGTRPRCPPGRPPRSSAIAYTRFGERARHASPGRADRAGCAASLPPPAPLARAAAPARLELATAGRPLAFGSVPGYFQAPRGSFLNPDPLEERPHPGTRPLRTGGHRYRRTGRSGHARRRPDRRPAASLPT